MPTYRRIVATKCGGPFPSAGYHLVHSKEFPVAVQTFRHAAKLSTSGHLLLNSILAMLALLYDTAIEETVPAYRTVGNRISLYEHCKSLTTIRREAADQP